MLFLVGREARAFTELKREVAGLKRTVGAMEDSFTRATAEQMTLVRQATKQLVDLSAAHRGLEEDVRRGRDAAAGAGAGGAAGADVVTKGLGVDVGVGAGGGAAEGVGAAYLRDGRRERQRPRGQAAGGGGGGDGGGDGNLREGGGSSADEGLWETRRSEAKAAGGLAKSVKEVKEGELPWDR